MTDRRKVIAGLAAIVAAIAIAPNRRALALMRPLHRREVPVTAWQIVLDGRWHFEENEETGRFCIRHVNSGYGFAKKPYASGRRPHFHCIAPGQTRDPATLRNCFARAATFVAKEAAVLREARGHHGAIYLDYEQSDPKRIFDKIETEDAPPTDWVGHLYEWRDFERIFSA